LMIRRKGRPFLWIGVLTLLMLCYLFQVFMMTYRSTYYINGRYLIQYYGLGVLFILAFSRFFLAKAKPVVFWSVILLLLIHLHGFDFPVSLFKETGTAVNMLETIPANHTMRYQALKKVLEQTKDTPLLIVMSRRYTSHIPEFYFMYILPPGRARIYCID